MRGDSGIAGLIIIVINVLVSYYGFRNKAFFDAYKFEIDPILKYRDYKRLITSGFLHANWQHLIMNMITLYFFSSAIESYMGAIPFLVIYFASLLGGDLLSLFIHRHHGDYSSIGASGAVNGIVFAFIALFPSAGIGLFFYLPAWIFGILYTLVSIYGIRSRKGNIGHDAHLGGGIIGMWTAIAFRPQLLAVNYIPILLITLPATAFILLIIYKPHILLVDNLFFKSRKKNYTQDDRFNDQKINEQQKIDQILEKIHRKGVDSLTRKEKQALDEHSKKIN